MRHEVDSMKNTDKNRAPRPSTTESTPASSDLPGRRYGGNITLTNGQSATSNSTLKSCGPIMEESPSSKQSVGTRSEKLFNGGLYPSIYNSISLTNFCDFTLKAYRFIPVPNDVVSYSPLELKHEIDVWKKACNSIPGYSRDENSVRTVLKRKVMALENVLRKHLYDDQHADDDSFHDNLAELSQRYKIRNKPLLIKSGIVMTGVISLFFLQSIPSLDLSLGWIALLGALTLLILADFDELESIIGRVEWSTLLFFASLFVVMEALEELRFLWWIGQLTQNAINSFSDEHKLFAAIVIILWVSALSSSLIDNIPFATVMIKIVEDLADSDKIDLPMTPLVYALAFGACLGGKEGSAAVFRQI